MICHDVQNKTLFKSSAIGACFNFVVDDVGFKSKNINLAIANIYFSQLTTQIFFWQSSRRCKFALPALIASRRLALTPLPDLQ